ncbi:MAG: TonB-dependent receptor [Agriterribacter sp.]
MKKSNLFALIKPLFNGYYPLATLLLFTVNAGYSLPLTKNISGNFKNSDGNHSRFSDFTGTVINAKNEPLAGATVTIKGSSGGYITNADGRFTIKTGDGGSTIEVEISLVGYQTQTLTLTANTNPVITLTEVYTGLTDVVVVGYGTQKRTSITGAVGKVKIDNDISARPNAEFGQALYGKVAGVQVVSGNGKPGSSSSIQIRGINSVSAGSTPLIVIDGIPTPNYDLNLINSSDIESIEILKDAASSAIYGSRAANGVVLVTTKKGRSGQAKLDLNYVTGIQQVIDKVDVMNAAEYAQASIDAAQNGWIQKGGDPNAPNTIDARGQYKYTWPTALENPGTLPNTDFQDLIYRSAPVNRVNLNITGGSEKSTFLLSGGYINQKGIALSSQYQKYSVSLKNITHVYNWLEVGGATTLSFDHETEPYSRMFEWAAQYPSIYPVYSENGYLGSPNNQPGFEKYNAILFRPQNGHPLYRIGDDIQRRRLNNLGNLYAQLNVIPGLSFKTAFNYYLNRTDNSNYQSVDHNLGPAYYTQGIMTVDQTRILNYTFQNLLTYSKSIGDHDINALLGTEYNYNDLYYTNQERRGYDNDLLHALAVGKTVFEATDNVAKSKLISYFARLNYDYKNTWLLSASIRRDGSSRFATNNKWGYFPAVSAGWVVSNEAFLSNSNTISNLKIRASYGLTGNDRFADYKWIGLITQGRTAFGTNLATTYYPSGITNPDLKWERTRQLDLGIELALYKNRIVLEADWYRSTSDGLLLDVPVPVVSGFTSVFKNIGKLENKGFEINLTTQNITGAFKWSSQINFSRNRNKLLALGEDNAPMLFTSAVASGMQKINVVGQPIFNFYGYQYGGVYKNQAEVDADPARYAAATPGDGRYIDIDNNKILDADDRTIIGNPAPDFIWGFTNNFSFKGFDLSILFQGVQGGELMDENAHRSMLYHEGRNYAKVLVNRWRSEAEPGDGYHYKLKVDLDGYEKTPSSYWLNDASYFRLKSLTLGYTVPSYLLSKIRISSARVYINATNLFTHKNTLVIDPEAFAGDVSDVTRRGVNGNSYPAAKVISLGINLGL